MNRDERNEYGCPLREQSGADAVRDFATLIASLAPDLRAAFEDERQARQQELDAYVASYGYAT